MTEHLQRRPDGFRFDVKAYSLLTGHPTKPQGLWKDLREGLSEQAREKRTLYPPVSPRPRGPRGGVAAVRGRAGAAAGGRPAGGRLVSVSAVVSPQPEAPSAAQGPARTAARLWRLRRAALAAVGGQRPRPRAYPRAAARSATHLRVRRRPA